MAIPIFFNSVNVNGQYTTSTVSIGQNTQTGWTGQSKNNFGVGPLMGMCISFTPITFVFDPDVFESPMPATNLDPSLQNQQI